MHRMDLSSMVMLKDNHVWSQGKQRARLQMEEQSCTSQAPNPAPRSDLTPIRINYQGGEEGS